MLTPIGGPRTEFNGIPESRLDGIEA